MYLKKILLASVAGVVVFTAQIIPVFATSANISHSYRSLSDIPAGSLVSLTTSQPVTIEAADSTNSSRLVGVVVKKDESLLAVDATDSTTQVANSGTVSVLVSTANGEIAEGDQIAVSQFAGIGMKAEKGMRIIGLGLSSLTSKTKGTVTRDVTDLSGKKQSIVVGFVSVSIAIGTATTNDKTNQNGLPKIAQGIAGHPVSTARIALSVAIAVIALAALISLIYGAIFGSIIAVGRNPLAKSSILRTLSYVMFMVLVTAGIAIVTIFLFLR